MRVASRRGACLLLSGRLVLWAVIPLANPACGGMRSGTSSDASDPFPGTWQCAETDDLTFTAPPNQPPLHQTESTGISFAVDGDASLALTDEGNGISPCPRRYSVTGATASLNAGQTCQSADQVKSYSSGSASVESGTLTVSESYSFRAPFATVDGGTVGLAGAGTSSYKCTKH